MTAQPTDGGTAAAGPREPPADGATDSAEAALPQPAGLALADDRDQPLASSYAPVMAAASEGDWLSGICPYLRGADGAQRTNEPDPVHRCAAQDPPGALPLAFQERFCLTERYPRCEMFKYAQDAAGPNAVPADLLPGGAPTSRRSLRLMTGQGDGSARRPAVIAVAGIGGVIIIVFVLLLGLGSCSGGGGGGGEQASGEPLASATPSATPHATPVPTPVVTPTPDAEEVTPQPGTEGSPSATTPLTDDTVEILYEIQEGEALKRIAETFGTSRRRILRANPGLEEIAPADLPGEVIIVPISPGMSVEELEALPGYRGPAG